MLQIARFGAIAICDSNRESQITSDLKGSALRFCCDLKRGSNHKSRDLKVRFEPLFTAICGKCLRFGLRDLKSLAICDFNVAPVRFGSVTVWGWNGSSGSGFRFRRFLCKKGFSVSQYLFTGKDGSGYRKTVLAVPVPLSVSGNTLEGEKRHPPPHFGS